MRDRTILPLWAAYWVIPTFIIGLAIRCGTPTEERLQAALPASTSVPVMSAPPTAPTTSTTTTSTTATIPPTTTTVPAGDWRCDSWIPLLVEVGFPDDQLRTADRILYAESRCDPDAYNASDPHGGSYGGFQMNGVHEGWLRDAGVIDTVTDLYSPWRNALAALLLWQEQGWHPWSTY